MFRFPVSGCADAVFSPDASLSSVLFRRPETFRSNENTPRMLEFAIAYARQGLPVFPVWGVVNGRCACGSPKCWAGRDGGKHPVSHLVPNGLLGATTDEATIRRWWGDAPHNVGIAVPKGRAVIDVDPKNGGTETWAALTAQHGALPRTAAVATGGGGFHAWLTLPDNEFRLPSKLGPGIDIRQDGGYVVAPPSTHLSGRSYSWIVEPGEMSPAPEWVTVRGYRETADERAALQQLDVRTIDPPTQPTAAHQALAAALTPWCVDGQKHNLAKALGGWLRQRGWSAGDVVATLECLPFHDPRKRIAGALNCYAAATANGWDDLRALVGEPAAEWLDRGTPNKIRDDLHAERKAVSDWWVQHVEPLVVHVPRNAVATVLPPALDGDPFCGLPLIRADRELVPLVRLVEGLDIVHGFSTGIVGRPFTAKTPFAMILALCVANGVPFAGRATIRTPVVYLAHEKITGVDRLRVRAAAALGVDPESVPIVNMTRFPLNGVGVVERLANVSRNLGKPVFIVDTYGAAVRGVEHNAAAYAEPLSSLANALTEAGACFLAVLHARKGEGPARLEDCEGHSAIQGVLQGAISLHRHDPENKTSIDVMGSRTLDREQPPLRVRFTDPEITGLREPGIAAEGVDLQAESIANADDGDSRLTRKQRETMLLEGKILAQLVGNPSGLSYSVLRQFSPAPKEVRDTLKELQRAGKINLAKIGTEEYYTLKENTAL